MRRHGTRTKYLHDRCRCFECTLANTNYEYNRTHGLLENNWTDPQPARTRLRYLRSKGFGLRRIAKEAGLRRQVLQPIAAGTRTRIHTATADAILSLRIRAGQLITDSHDQGVDEIAIARHLAGDHTPTLSPAERREVIHRWQAAGRSLAALQRETGWNVHRDLRDTQAAS